MTGIGTSIAPFDLPLPAAVAEHPLEPLLARSGKTFMAVFESSAGYPPPEELRPAVEGAAAFLDECVASQAALREALRLLTPDEVRERLAEFVMSWPNVRDVDLTIFGEALLRMVEGRRPTRYSLDVGLDRAIEANRYLPSIAVVLEAVDEAQARIRATAFHVNELPGVLDKARTALARAEQRQASIDRHRAARDGGGTPPEGSP